MYTSDQVLSLSSILLVSRSLQDVTWLHFPATFSPLSVVYEEAVHVRRIQAIDLRHVLALLSFL